MRCAGSVQPRPGRRSPPSFARRARPSGAPPVLRSTRRLSLLAVLAAALLVVTACGDDDDDADSTAAATAAGEASASTVAEAPPPDPAELLARAALPTGPVASDVKLQVKIDGAPTDPIAAALLSGPVEVTAK